ncbi:uncharacterized protein Bfra_006130 [Botrytis fragariae]|uniref:Uncharacterized protein n=1 Tax=Botrytis fragariae TaxID=1964551 RepID=A0A8H6ASF0_9HELO|nr:uncharacterized protein Bfra_006130 [Botrytis fragariae]KAF5872767.1 hypothetical protein Bfra_006130 [Botrytis fragariae]
MSTEIPFTANHTQQPFKLLELPPELLTLLESDVPPTITRIASISDTIELIEKEEELIDGEGKDKDQATKTEVTKKTATGKVNKWHEKFAKSRGNGANTKG